MSDFFTIEGKRDEALNTADLPTRGYREFALTEDGQILVLDGCGNYNSSKGVYPAMIPPLSKEEFVRYIKAIKSLDDGIDKINNVMNEVCQDNVYYPPTLKEELLNLLIKLFHDEKTDWIFYFLYELDFGKNWTESSITENGIPVKMKTPEDLYDVLIKNMQQEYKEFHA